MKVVFVLVVICVFQGAFGLDNGLGRTPPMGWNSWNKFGCKINEQIVKDAAHKLIDLGLANLGYNYVNIDDCWQKSRDSEGRIVEDNVAFPSGIKALADYVHSLGLKFGLYSSAGLLTCQWRPGSLNYEEQDAKSYTEWGIDYLKYDNCFNEFISSKVRYPKMRDAIAKAGGSNKIFYSMCQWGEENVATWAESVANSWRTTLDIADNWHSFTYILDLQHGLEKYAKPGAWNDPDMLEVGNGGMTTVESQSHFALWAVLKAPLLIGCDLANIKKEDLEILSNEELIDINQDKLGKQAARVQRGGNWYSGYLDTYVGQLSRGSFVLVFHNRTSQKQKMNVVFKEAGMDVQGVNVRDVLKHYDIGFNLDNFETEVESHGVFVGVIHQFCVSSTDDVKCYHDEEKKQADQSRLRNLK